MEKQSGPLPITGFIILDSFPDQWKLFSEQHTTQLTTFGIIEYEGKKVKVEIEIKKANTAIIDFNDPSIAWLSNMPEAGARGYIRIYRFMRNMIEGGNWVLIGFIKGKNNIPVTIVHYAALEKTVYSQKLIGEEDTSFAGFSLN